MRRLHATLISVTLAALAALMLAMTVTPARAASSSSWLVLSVYKGDTPSPATVLSTVTLTCDADGGTHPQPGKACDALRSVDGHIERLPGDPGICPLIFAPETATADGQWRGRYVHFQQTYSNSCVLHRALTPVYDF
jgi:hypothetical protein